ncbi:MAG: DUF4157 domain-containing protein [Gammaproteobacteria bacterium]|nr:DUF4157 domain-containing protein [Gammaproteobacteria bacterium]
MARSGLPRAVIAALQPYFHDFELGALRVRHRIPRYVVGRPAGYASGNDICFPAGCFDPHTADGLALIAHEAWHSRQYRQLGTWRFRIRYVGEYLAGRLRGRGHDAAYRGISLEREAQALEERVRRDLAAVVSRDRR